MAFPYVTTAQLEKAVNELGREKQDKIEVTSADVGKMIAVSEEGELTLVDAPSGGTKMYRHVIYTYRDEKGDEYVNHIVIINTDPTPITKTTFENKLKNCVSYYGYKSGFTSGAFMGFNNTYLYYGNYSEMYDESFSSFASSEYDTFTDTVTPL